ncbi:MAG TPA: cupin domain-containing protein [Acidimicrobiia bacterium]|nr:cupin domain-containing protein [Acidimicrobiia bacterium]HZQ79303.1 cupin domain-containing protein [Acidimicrobiia bacterium]
MNDDALDEFYAELHRHHLEALWRINSTIMPFEPKPRARAWLWRHGDLLRLAELAGKLVPIDRGGDRRVLAAVNPGLAEAYGDAVYGATATLWGAVQYLGPHESAPAHRHSPSALRFVVEGSGAWTTVDGERLAMAPGDLVLTPPYAWHDHQNDSDEPMAWFDGLDLPLACYLDAQFFELHPSGALQEPGSGGTPPPAGARPGARSTVLRYPWAETEAALEGRRVQPDPYDDVHIRFTNPGTGGPVLPTLDATIQMLRAGIRTMPHRHVHSTVYQVFRGRGETIVDGVRFSWERGDLFALPPWVVHEHHAPDNDAVLFSITDAPVLGVLGLERVLGFTAGQTVTGDFDPGSR